MNCFQLYFFINLTNYLNIILIKINFKLLIFIENQKKNKYYQKKIHTIDLQQNRLLLLFYFNYYLKLILI